MGDQLLPLSLTERTLYLCVDMQRIFLAEGPWPTPRMDRVLPVVAALANRHPERAVFTRFISPSVQTKCRACGGAITGAGALRPASAWISGCAGGDTAGGGACPPATVIGQNRYSSFAEPRLVEHLRQRETDALIVSGSETDVCVLATVLDAVDIGFRVIVVRDAVCSSSDERHEMLMRLYHTRYTEQIETADAATILARWE
jgi:nicotinamidase-related amidase